MRAGRMKSVLEVLILSLALATAGIHFYLVLLIWNVAHRLDIVFSLNTLGYLALAAALLLPLPISLINDRKHLVHYAFIAYTAATIIAWYFMGTHSILAYADKAIEVFLIVALVLHLRITQKERAMTG